MQNISNKKKLKRIYRNIHNTVTLREKEIFVSLKKTAEYQIIKVMIFVISSWRTTTRSNILVISEFHEVPIFRK